MVFSFIGLIIHVFCALGLFLIARLWRAHRPWPLLCFLLFFFSPPAVSLIWGPRRLYILYALAFFIFLGMAKGGAVFDAFLKTQEALIRYLFWLAVAVLSGAVLITTLSEVSIRRDALTYWSREARIHPSAPVFDHLADAYAHRGDTARARANYLQALNQDHHFVHAYQGLAELARQAGQWKQVIEADHGVIGLQPKSRRAYLGLGEAYRILGKSQQAVEAYTTLLNFYPDDEQTYVKVIEAYSHAVAAEPKNILYQEKREDVLADFEQLSRRKNYNAMDYYNLAFLYEQVGGKDEAIRFYTKAVKMKPDYAQALFNLAHLYQNQGHYKIAMDLYERLVHAHPKFAAAYLNMGMIFNALGDQQKARQFYLKTIHEAPDNSQAYFDLGYLNESQGDLRDAMDYYEKAVRADPKNAEAYYNLGNVYAKLGQSEEAIALYLKTVGVNPKHQNAYVNLSILSFKDGDFQGAIHYLEQAEKLGYNPPLEYLKTLEPYRQK